MKPILKLFAAPAFAFAIAACPQANASIVKQADGTSFLDTHTGYLWRTLAQYDGATFGAASTALPTGYRVATEAQLAILAADADADLATFDAELAAMGAKAANDILWGFYGDGTAYAWKTRYDTAWSFSSQDPWNYGVPADFATDGLSLFAVNTSVATSQGEVPEPATLALIGLGLAGLKARRRAKQVR